MASDGRAASPFRLLIIGVGNSYRHDDAAGLVVLRKLRGQAPSWVGLLEESGEGTSLMEAWKNSDGTILIDAVSSGAPYGTIHRLDTNKQTIIKDTFCFSIHAFGVTEAIELSRVLNQLPKNLIIYGIEGRDFKAGLGLSPEVERAVGQVAEMALRDVNLMVSHQK